MNRKTWNANPSRDLSYTSLVIDEQNRSQHAHKIADSARFFAAPTNGDLGTVVPDYTNVKENLPRHLRVDTNTRTLFSNPEYHPKPGIAEFVADPDHTVHSVRAPPHVSMDELCPVDTRIRRLKWPYEAPLGPGYYEPDPLGERSTGTLAMVPGDVHHAVPLARDPTRPSAVFLSPTRGRTAPDIAVEAAAPPTLGRMSEPDFEYWTSKGCWAPRGDRVIEADRWGKNARELKPPADERPQSVYTPKLTIDGQPNSCENYTADPMTPAYKVAFSSGLPRTLALPLGNKPDTRLLVKSYDGVTAAQPDVGPGSYNPEPPRMRSNNAAFDTAMPYFSNASGTPVEPSTHGGGSLGSTLTTSLAALLPPQLQQQLAAAGTLSLLTMNSAPSTPVVRNRAAGGLAPLAHSGSGGGASGGHHSAPSSPSAMRAAAVRAERAAAVVMLASASGGGQHAGGGAGGPARERALMPSPLGPAASGRRAVVGQGHGPGLSDEDGGGGRSPSPGWSRAQSAPASPHNASSVAASMRAEQARQFTKLVFLQRHTPCSSLLRSHLIVAADLRKERQRLRNAG